MFMTSRYYDAWHFDTNSSPFNRTVLIGVFPTGRKNNHAELEQHCYGPFKMVRSTCIPIVTYTYVLCINLIIVIISINVFQLRVRNFFFRKFTRIYNFKFNSSSISLIVAVLDI
jgi:hypothetical protein